MGVNVLRLTWPWAKKKNRTVNSYDTRGRLRVLCVGSSSPATGEITHKVSQDGSRASRWTRCLECGDTVRVTGLKSHPRLTVHNGKDKA